MSWGLRAPLGTTSAGHGGAPPPRNPSTSQPLSQPPGEGTYLVHGLEYRLQDSHVFSNQPCRFQNFFLAPIPELCSASFSSDFQKIQKIMSTQLTQHFLTFLEMQKIMLGQLGRHYFLNFLEMRRSTRRKKSGMGPRKKVPESASLAVL